MLKCRGSYLKDSIVFLSGLTLGCMVMALAGLERGDNPVESAFPLQQEMAEIQQLKQQADNTFNSVVKKIALLDAQTITMDTKLQAVAESLNVQLQSEQNIPYVANYLLGVEQSDMNLYAAIASMEYTLLQKAHQLDLLEELAQNKTLNEHTKLAGKVDIVKGWISSYYGTRIDPLTGNKKWHSGVDIGSHHGREVKSVATGVVTFAGEKGGYGNTLEISHGDGLMTRYGHNQDLLAKEGDIVHKGTPIALVGNTGRATGPHVHFETRENGLAVDPAKYFPQFSRKT